MQLTTLKTILTISLLFFICGCTPRAAYTQSYSSTQVQAPKDIWSFVPVRASVETKDYVIKLEPSNLNPSAGTYAYQLFILSVQNKSKKDIVINWDKTLYIVNNQTSGGFMFDGILYKDRNNPKSPDIVFSGSRLEKTIYPNNLVEFVSTKYYSDWVNNHMPEGENGVYLTLSIDGKDVNEKLIVKLSKNI